MKLLISMISFLLSASLFAGGSIGGSTGGAHLKEGFEVMETIILDRLIIEDLKLQLETQKSVPLQIDDQIFNMKKFDSRIVDESLSLEVLSE
jgi:hypothetical protein